MTQKTMQLAVGQAVNQAAKSCDMLHEHTPEAGCCPARIYLTPSCMCRAQSTPHSVPTSPTAGLHLTGCSAFHITTKANLPVTMEFPSKIHPKHWCTD